jgi:hypothetical protein
VKSSTASLADAARAPNFAHPRAAESARGR